MWSSATQAAPNAAPPNAVPPNTAEPRRGAKRRNHVSSITVVKRDGTREPYDANKINLAIENAAEGLDPSITWVTQIASELELTLFDGITTQQLDEAVIQVALQNVKDDPAFDTVAARLLLKTIYKRVLGDYSSDEDVRALHTQHFRAYVERGVAEELLDPRLGELFDLDALGAAL